MRQIILTTLFVIVATALNAQISLEKTYNFSTSVVKLETLGYKYFLMDVPNSQCKIYNMDHSVFKTINCPVPNGYYLADIKYISENLFNPDSQIELAYIYYKYVPTATSYYYIYGAKVINESGNTLQPIESAQYVFVNKTSDSGYKLFAYCYDYSVSPEKVWTNIYSLPGSPVASLSISSKLPDTYLSAYPNPATDIVHLEYQLPTKTKSANLYLTNSNGKAVKNFQIDGHTNYLELNVNELASGVYFYYAEYDNIRTSSKKIVVK